MGTSVIPQHIQTHPKTLQIKDCGFRIAFYLIKINVWFKRMAIVMLKAEDKITIYIR